MIWLYRIFFIPAFILCLPYYLRRMIKRGGYSKDFKHRFGSIPKLPPRSSKHSRIWIHAVSVGEIRAIEPLINRLLEDLSVEIVLSTTTSTAYKIAN